jgi:hypothetical protein
MFRWAAIERSRIFSACIPGKWNGWPRELRFAILRKADHFPDEGGRILVAWSTQVRPSPLQPETRHEERNVAKYKQVYELLLFQNALPPHAVYAVYAWEQGFLYSSSSELVGVRIDHIDCIHS